MYSQIFTGVYLQVSGIQNMYIQVAEFSMYIHYTGISSSGMYIQASDIQDMYIQVAVLSMYRYIYRYQFFR